MKYIDGGICAAKGFKASGLHCGVKSRRLDKKDVALIVSDCDCAAAAVYTKNVVKAAPLHVTRAHLADGIARAVIANSGNANACAPHGEENAEKMCGFVTNALGIPSENVIVASTGVIGQTINTEVIEKGMPELVSLLDYNGSQMAADAIMTTDTVRKEAAVEIELDGKSVHIGGISKGSGMIHPNMGTMLCFITTDAAISSKMLKKALLDTVNVTFNRISVDGDTSTNDMCVIMANALAENTEIAEQNENYEVFASALKELCQTLARKMAADGEGARHLITCTVNGADSVEKAETIAKSVISSTLTKAAIFGCDANWGRVLCAMGYSGAEFDPETVDVAFKSNAGEIQVCLSGRGLDFDEDLAKKILTEPEIEILIGLKEGNEECTCWGCDITYDYIKINGDYRT